MEIEKVIQKSYIIKLSTEEACWLKGIMQNPLFDQTPEDEDPFDREIREKLFHGLNWS